MLSKLLLAGAALGVVVGVGATVTPALAEEAPSGALVSGMQLAQVPPPPPMPALAPNWTGFYLGAFVGGKTQAIR